jgi:hypothetical protein
LWHDDSPIPSWAPWAPNFPPKGNKLIPHLRITYVHESRFRSSWEVAPTSKPLRYICENLVDPEDPVPTEEPPEVTTEEPPEVTEPEVTTEEPIITTTEVPSTTKEPCRVSRGIYEFSKRCI